MFCQKRDGQTLPLLQLPPRNCDEYRTGIRAEKIASGFEEIMRDDAV